MLAGAVSMSRIFGKVWLYLLQWAWGVATLLLLAVAWTAFVALRSRLSPGTTRRLATAGIASRRKIEQMILDGRISVNGRTTRTLGEVLAAVGG